MTTGRAFPPRLPLYLAVPMMVTFLGASVVAQLSVDNDWVGLRSQPPKRDYVLPGQTLRALSMGQNGLLANLYWTRAVQYFGTQRLTHANDFSLLKPLIDTAVQLDPQLLIAYYAGGFFLSTPRPRGAGRPDQAVDLLQRGIQANPDAWRLWHHLGFTYYWELGEYEKASAAYLEGSKNPKALPWMKVMAASITAKGGNRETSRFMWTEILNSTDDETIKANARRNLMLLTVSDDVDGLQRATEKFHDRNGRWPESFRELIAAGFLRSEPRDPLKYPYLLLGYGKISVNPDSPLAYDSIPSPSHVAGSRSVEGPGSAQ